MCSLLLVALLIGTRSTAVDILRHHPSQENVVVAYFYFHYQDHPKQTAIQVLRTLLKQVVSTLDNVPSGLRELYENCTSRSINPDLPAIVEQFLACCRDFGRVCVMLDGLDECDDSQQPHLVSIIRELLTQPSLRVMLTCRLYLPVVESLSRTGLCINIVAEDADIRTYLSSRLETVEFLSQELKRQVVDVIAQGAEGM